MLPIYGPQVDILPSLAGNFQPYAGHLIVHELREAKKKHLDGLSPTYLKTPPAPLKMDYVFFHYCFIVLFQFLDIIFTLKVKKKCEKWTRPETPPPHCGLSPSKCFFCFFLTSLIKYLDIHAFSD